MYSAIPPLDNPEFVSAKQDYFRHLASDLLTPLRMHRKQGLWEHDENGERDWGNVSSHCLVEAARVSVYADLLGLDENLKHDLEVAASVHDFYKKDEIKKLRANGTSWDSYEEAQDEAHELLKESGLFTDRQIWLATSVGHSTSKQAEELAAKKDLTPDEKAWLVMHYVDDYTIDDKWVEPATLDEDGIFENDFDRCVDTVVGVHSAPGGKYHGIQQAGYEHFGEPTYNIWYRAGLAVQNRLAELIGNYTEHPIENPKLLPEMADSILARQILDTNS